MAAHNFGSLAAQNQLTVEFTLFWQIGTVYFAYKLIHVANF